MMVYLIHSAPSGLHDFAHPSPRALPWAIALSHVAAKSFISPAKCNLATQGITQKSSAPKEQNAMPPNNVQTFFALKERHAIAQGNALGLLVKMSLALKGRNVGGTSSNQILTTN